MERIAHRVLVERKYAGWSQKHLAEVAGLSVTTINHIEKDKNTDLETIQKIEKALGRKLY